MADICGQTFDGFEVLSKLGQGGMGAVYKARQISLNRFVALKVMSNALAEDQEFIERFKREASTAAQFKHPNIVQVHAAGESNGIYYMAMEFVEGRTLREHIRSRGRLDPQEAIAITLHVAEGLKYAWNKSRMIHRDIKPDNVFLSQTGEVLVGDLGLAKNLGGASTEMTSTGMMLGSPHYISPEQAMAAKDIDFRADIYSLGCTLYHMLTGRTAYEGDSSMVLLMKHVQEPPPDIFKALPECPRKLGVMVGRMMAKNRNDRPPSYEELIAGLWEANESVSGKVEMGRSPAAQPLTATAVGRIASAMTVAAAPCKRFSPGMIYGVVGGAVVLLLAGLWLSSPWKSRITPIQDSEWKNLIPSIDPKRDGKPEGGNNWVVENGKLLCVNRGWWAFCEVPVDYVGGNYDLRFRVIRGEGADTSIFFLFRKDATGGVVVFDYLTKDLKETRDIKIAGLMNANGQSVASNSTRRERPCWLPNGQEKTVLIQVRDDGMVASLDGDEVFRWEGNWADVVQHGLITSTHNITRPVFGVCPSGCKAVFSAIEIRKVVGKGTFTRGAPSSTSDTPSLQHSAALNLLGNVFTNSVGAEMVYIPPGEFMLGSTKEEQEWAMAKGHKEAVKREGKAPRKAAIKQGFWMGRTEVTVGQWKQFVKETGYVTDGEKDGESYMPSGAGNLPLEPKKGVNWRKTGFGFEVQDEHPVNCISWNDAVTFCEWLTKQERKAGKLLAGMVVRLPTEAEWEYACRAGRQTRFWWGEAMEDGENRLNWNGKGDGFEFVAPVDQYKARGRNKFGLADMLGNVSEWCLDEYDPKQAHEECYQGNPGARVLRGGSFYSHPTHARGAHRGSNPPSRSSGDYGFRLAVGENVSGATAASTSPATVTREGGILAPAETRVSALTTNPKVGEVFTLLLGSNMTMELMGIPSGEFMLGSTKEEQAWALANGSLPKYVQFEGKQPRKTVIKQGFWLGRTEVTVGQWKLFVAATGYVTDGEKKGESTTYVRQNNTWGKVKGASWKDPGFELKLMDNHPVSCISWKDTMAFCAWLTDQEAKAGRLPPGFKVRLPTEAEWEYACRASNQTTFWWGDTKEGGENRLNWSGKDDGFEFVAPVDQYKARGRNKFGLADMLGNVWEWCLDEFDQEQAHEECYKGNPGACALRGGSFRDTPDSGRCAARHCIVPSYSHSHSGFRVAVGVAR